MSELISKLTTHKKFIYIFIIWYAVGLISFFLMAYYKDHSGQCPLDVYPTPFLDGMASDYSTYLWAIVWPLIIPLMYFGTC